MSATYNQIIQKPVSPTVVVTGGVSPVVDYTTGIVTVASGTPTSWTGQYDIPCRFAEDVPDLGLDESSGALLNWKQLKVIEVRDITSVSDTLRFPDFLAAWATGGRGFKTDIVETYGGNEFRNAAWSQARGEWEIQNAWQSARATNALYNQNVAMQFFMSCMGQLRGFRFKWFWDYTDSMNNGTGVFVMLTPTTFQMYKQYTVS